LASAYQGTLDIGCPRCFFMQKSSTPANRCNRSYACLVWWAFSGLSEFCLTPDGRRGAPNRMFRSKLGQDHANPGRVTPCAPRLQPAGAKFPWHPLPGPLAIKTFLEFPVRTSEFGLKRPGQRQTNTAAACCRPVFAGQKSRNWSLMAISSLGVAGAWPWPFWAGLRGGATR